MKPSNWREMREIATFFEQRPVLKETPWQAFVLWLNKEDDPRLWHAIASGAQTQTPTFFFTLDQAAEEAT